MEGGAIKLSTRSQDNGAAIEYIRRALTAILRNELDYKGLALCYLILISTEKN